MSDVLERAYRVHSEAIAQYPGDRRRGLAYPFGVTDATPDFRWRVSWDVMQELTEAAPPPYPIPNLKSSLGPTKLLLGWPIDVDRDARPGTMELLLSG